MKLNAMLASSLLASCLFTSPPAQAQSAASELSVLSALPVVVSVAVVGAAAGAAVVGASAVLSAGATLVVVSVEILAGATIWVLERASDGVRVSLRVGGKLAEGSAVVAGAALAVSVIGAGTVLSLAGQAIAFIPNEIGKALLYNEKVSR